MTQGRIGHPTRWAYPKGQQAGTAMAAADMAAMEERASTMWINGLFRYSWSWISPLDAPTCTIEAPSSGASFVYPNAPDAFDAVNLPIWLNAEAHRLRIVVWVATSTPANIPLTMYASGGASAPIVMSGAKPLPPGPWSHTTQPWVAVPVKLTVPYGGAVSTGFGAITLSAGLTDGMTDLADPLEGIGIKRVLKICQMKAREEVYVTP